MNGLTLYKSSAGSGKTTVLSREYLKLAIRRNFRNILAVTFTNKATHELKDRVISKLSFFVDNPDSQEAQEIRRELNMDAGKFSARCQEVLSQILNNYGAFSISTIDAFFQKIIRSFARESGIQGNFRLEIEHDQVLDHAIQRLFEEAGKNKTLTRWLIRFSHDVVENSEGGDLTKKVRALGEEVFSEEFKVIQSVVSKEGSIARFEELEREISSIIKGISDEISNRALGIVKVFEENGIELSNLITGLDTQLIKMTEGMIPDSTKRYEDALVTAENFTFKNNPFRKQVIQLAEDGILQELRDIDSFINANKEEYYTAKVIQENLYTFGILSDLLRKIDEYKYENDILLLSDSSLFLAQIIQGYDSPFIYEKVGSRYRNFLIDEFQDTSMFQWNNFRPLLENSLAEGQKSILVGDVKQSIYRFRGGDWDLIASQVNREFPHAEINNLSTNWRSEGKIISFNNQFFQDALTEFSRLFSLKASEEIEGDKVIPFIDNFSEIYSDIRQELPGHRDPDKGYVEIEFFPGKYDKEFQEYSMKRTVEIVERLQTKGLRPKDIAILVRTRLEGERIASYLIEHSKSDQAKDDVSYDVVSSEILRIANSPSVNLIVAVMKWLNKREELIPFVSFISDYMIYFNEGEYSLSEVFEKVYNEKFEELLPEKFMEDIESISKLQLYELSEEIIRRFGLMGRKSEWPYILGFQDELLQFSTREAGDLNTFLEWWELKGWDLPVNISEEIDAIQILTIHKAKGLQFEAVILPMCNWKIEADGKRSSIIWTNIDREPYNLFSFYPLKYSKSLARSAFYKDYLQEKFSNYVDNINLLYVAFTRAIQGLYAIVPNVSEENTGRLIRDVLLKGTDSSLLKFGEENYRIPEEKTDHQKTIELKRFHSNRWNDRVTIATRELIKLKEDVYERVELGELVHDVLSELQTTSELDLLLNRYELKGRINNGQKIIIKESIDKILEQKEVRSWFEGEVINEGVLLGGKGIIRRPDKVVIKDDRVIVIDFKTGSERPEHEGQVKDYVDMLQKMYKKKVEGKLCYLQPLKILSVE